MSIISSDPLAFLTAQGGIVGTPLTEAGASGAESLDVQQRGAVVGEPIPIVFCRRVSGTGGVLISPPATEARFEDDASSNITASYHLVLSEGQIDSIQVRDVFQRSCRVGSYTQTYNRRAGTFVPGNFIDESPGLEAPYYCGTSGTYQGLSTMAFSVTIPAGFDQWNRQVHCFVRGGMRITRLLDNTLGPSNNVADLLLYLLRNSSKVPEAQIDTTSLLAAATFTNANGFWFNGVVSESTNLRDWIGDVLPYFLLRQARIGGKEALKPLLPTNSNGSIKTTAVTWAFTFTEEHIIPDSFEIVYTPLADRKPFCATVLWRQQDDLGIPVMRTAEVRYSGTALDGPFEQHDLTGFCASEDHAIKVGAYILSKRRHVTHRLQLGVKPDAFNPTLSVGDLVRVRLERIASTGANSLHDYLYEVDRIGKSITGEVRLELTHFPVDTNRVSVVAQEVAAAVGTGLLLPTGLTGVTCDVNSNADTSIPAETFTEDTFPDYTTDIDDLDPGNFGGGGFGGGIGGFDGGSQDNPENTLDGQQDPIGGAIQTDAIGNLPGATATAPETCPGATYQWTRNGVNISGATSSTYTPGINDIGQNVQVKITCPDGSSGFSDSLFVAAQPQFRFDQPISATVNYTTKFVDGGTLFCNTSPTPSGGTPSVGSSSVSVTSVYRVQPVQIITAPGGGATTGYGPPAFSYTNSCLASVTWMNGNLAILSLNNTGAVTGTSFLGGGSGYSQQTYANTFTGTLTINSIILTANAPGLGVIGDNVLRAGLGWYADVAYVDRNYGRVYINGVLQPFNPYGPPTTP